MFRHVSHELCGGCFLAWQRFAPGHDVLLNGTKGCPPSGGGAAVCVHCKISLTMFHNVASTTSVLLGRDGMRLLKQTLTCPNARCKPNWQTCVSKRSAGSRRTGGHESHESHESHGTSGQASLGLEQLCCQCKALKSAEGAYRVHGL